MDSGNTVLQNSFFDNYKIGDEELQYFKILENYPDYKICKNGNVFSTKRNPEKLISGKFDKDGYREYHLRDKNGKSVHVRGHRLIAIAWVDNPKDFNIVNHKDGNKINNNAENLEWCTVQYNTQHGYDNLGRKGQNGGMNKRVALCDMNWTVLEEFDSFRALASHLELKSGTAGITSYFKRAERIGSIATIRGKYRAKLI